MGDLESILAELAKTDIRHGGFIQAALDENAALKDQLEKAQKDAERYRWLKETIGTREHGVPTISWWDDDRSWYSYPSNRFEGTQLDAAIDKAMEAGE